MHCQLCTAVTLHCVLLSQFNIQIRNTATTPSPSQLGMILAGDQLAIHNTAPSSLFWTQYHSTGTDRLLQSAQFTVWYIAPERLHTSPGIYELNKETLKTQSETGEAEVQLHSSFNKRTEFSENCNSEHGKLAELLPEWQNMYSFQATVQVVNPPIIAQIQLSVVNKKPFLNSDISMWSVPSGRQGER